MHRIQTMYLSFWIYHTALYFFAVSTIAAFVGQHVVRKLINILGRASIIIFTLSLTIFVSALSLGMISHSSFMQVFIVISRRGLWNCYIWRILKLMNDFVPLQTYRWYRLSQNGPKDWSQGVHGIRQHLFVYMKVTKIEGLTSRDEVLDSNIYHLFWLVISNFLVKKRIV